MQYSTSFLFTFTLLSLTLAEPFPKLHLRDTSSPSNTTSTGTGAIIGELKTQPGTTTATGEIVVPASDRCMFFNSMVNTAKATQHGWLYYGLEGLTVCAATGSGVNAAFANWVVPCSQNGWKAVQWYNQALGQRNQVNISSPDVPNGFSLPLQCNSEAGTIFCSGYACLPGSSS